MARHEIAENLFTAGLSEPEALGKGRLFEAVHQRLGGSGKMSCWFVPGRIEVFGKHTDYAGGRSLLCAVERGFCVAARPRSDQAVHIADVVLGLEARLDLSEQESVGSGEHWTIYPTTVVRRIARDFPGPLRGADIAFASDLPRSAGLSSGSALTIAIFTALADLNGLEQRVEYRQNIRTPADLAGYLGAVENGLHFGTLRGDRGVGTFGGSEDHTAILCGRPGRLSQYSFCPVRFERDVALPAAWTFVVASSGVAAEKAGAARERYNRLSLATKEILARWRKATGETPSTLGEVVSVEAAAARMRQVLSGSGLSDRFEQFSEESEVLVPAASEAFERQDSESLADAAARSQAGAERLLGNQVPETIGLVSGAGARGAIASSAFGAGFGGGVWAVVPKSQAEEFRAAWEADYQRRFPAAASSAKFFVTGAGPGLLRLPEE